MDNDGFSKDLQNIKKSNVKILDIEVESPEEEENDEKYHNLNLQDLVETEVS